MDKQLGGIHHVTAITGDAQANVDFYTGVLGLRLAKQTVNYDDPGTYHLYFGDEVGSPGTVITFFAWPGLPKRQIAAGRRRAGETYATAFSIPIGSVGYWTERLVAMGVALVERSDRFERASITFADPDGLILEVVEAEDPRVPWTGIVAAEHAIRGFQSVTFAEERPDVSAAFLTGFLGFRQTGEDGDRLRFETGLGGSGAIVDIVTANEPRNPMSRIGAVHHVAYRTPDDAGQTEWLRSLSERRVGVTPIQERNYFRSIYFREPGGVLYEIATDGPGFTIDEPSATIGSRLQLPPWLETNRDEIVRGLPPINVSETNVAKDSAEAAA